MVVWALGWFSLLTEDGMDSLSLSLYFVVTYLELLAGLSGV